MRFEDSKHVVKVLGRPLNIVLAVYKRGTTDFKADTPRITYPIKNTDSRVACISSSQEWDKTAKLVYYLAFLQTKQEFYIPRSMKADDMIDNLLNERTSRVIIKSVITSFYKETFYLGRDYLWRGYLDSETIPTHPVNSVMDIFQKGLNWEVKPAIARRVMYLDLIKMQLVNEFIDFINPYQSFKRGPIDKKFGRIAAK